MKLSGVYAPITTPFNRAGEVDAEAAAANCRALIANGVGGIVIAGSTGEAALLDEAERDAVLAAVRRAVPGTQVLMGVGGESTRQTIDRAKRAAAGGANAALCVGPHYYGAGAMTDDALRAHYRAVADASPIPVVLYSIPKYMHFALSATLVGELAQHDNIVGIKDSSGDMSILTGYLAAQSDTFTVITGNAGQFLNGLRAGARGGILAVADFAPALSRAVYDGHQTGDAAAGEAAQALLAPLGAEIVARLSIAGIKAAVDTVGLTGGPVRMPLVDLDAAGRARVAALLSQAQVGTVEKMQGAA